MKRRLMRLTLVGVIVLIIFALVGCNMPRAGATPTQAQDVVFTAAAQTLEVELTRLGAAPTTPAPGTDGLATATPQPSATLAASATTTPLPCNQATFVSDVNYPDNTDVLPGASFQKTWRLKNTGTCTWTSGYQVIFESGDSMGVAATTALTPGTVPPNSTVDVTVSFTAPTTPGTYRANFRLRSPENVVFGIGADGMSQFWVQVKVPPPTATVTPTATLGLIIVLPTATLGGIIILPSATP